MPSFEKAFVIIPARNEMRQIASVVEAAQAADPLLVATDHVIVVNNDSTDTTPEIANALGAKVIDCAEIGKGHAMAEGARYALGMGAAALTFLDADLRGLTPEHITALAGPVLRHEAIMSIGYLGGRKPLAKRMYVHWGGFSGQRAVAPSLWERLRDSDFEDWRTEGALNAICRHQGLGDQIKRVELEDLRHLGKREKTSTLRQAAAEYIRTYASASRGLLTSSGK